MPYALQTITGPASRREYAKQGDEVPILHDHGNALIVQNQAGERFPVGAGQVGEEKGEVVPARIVQVEKRSVTRKGKVHTQSNMF